MTEQQIPEQLDLAEALRDVNEGSDGCPVRLTVDVGHQAGMHYGLSGPDLDYREWLRRFAAGCEIIHLQQTTPDGSHHWQLTDETARRGHVAAIRESHHQYPASTLAAVAPPVRRTILVAEIIPGSTKTEEKLLEELRESARYLRRFIPEGGLEIARSS